MLIRLLLWHHSQAYQKPHSFVTNTIITLTNSSETFYMFCWKSGRPKITRQQLGSLKITENPEFFQNRTERSSKYHNVSMIQVSCYSDHSSALKKPLKVMKWGFDPHEDQTWNLNSVIIKSLTKSQVVSLVQTCNSFMSNESQV